MKPEEVTFEQLKAKRDQWSNQSKEKRKELMLKHIREDLGVTGTVRRNGRNYDVAEYMYESVENG